MRIRKGEKRSGKIEKIVYKGKGITHLDGMVCFVTGAVPGDVVEIEIQKVKRSYCEGKVTGLLAASPDRIAPKCIHFGDCGGCKWQNLSYEAQLYWKREIVKESFEHLGKISAIEVRKTIPSPRLWHYRNKMDFSCGPAASSSSPPIHIGLHQAGRFDLLINLQECWLIHPKALQHLKQIREAANTLGTTGYDTVKQSGFLRNIVVRTTKDANQWLWIIVTSPPEKKADLLFIDWIFHEFPKSLTEEDTIIHAVTENKAQVATGRIVQSIGKGYLQEQLNGLLFRISPFAFFQPNPWQAEQTFQMMRTLSEVSSTDIVWDLYCGTGSISLHFAQKAYHVYGCEITESAIADARHNAKMNRIENVRFAAIDLHSSAGAEFLRNLPKPTLIVLDPPRSGLHPKIINVLKDTLPKRILYLSCNPTTQARDCNFLHEHYHLAFVQPIDMFPHTYHIESLVLLERKSVPK